MLGGLLAKSVITHNSCHVAPFPTSGAHLVKGYKNPNTSDRIPDLFCLPGHDCHPERKKSHLPRNSGDLRIGEHAYINNSSDCWNKTLHNKINKSFGLLQQHTAHNSKQITGQAPTWLLFEATRTKIAFKTYPHQDGDHRDTFYKTCNRTNRACANIEVTRKRAANAAEYPRLWNESHHMPCRY